MMASLTIAAPAHGAPWAVLVPALANEATRLMLTDGSRIAIRPMRPDDADAERALVDGLTQDSRYHRFHFGLRALSPDLLKRLTAEVDQQRHVAVVAEAVGGQAAPGLIADARYVRRSDSDEAEFALTVADAWQGRGLGRALFDHLRRDARQRGVTRLYGDVLWGHTAMIGLARSLGASLQGVPGDATLVRVRLVP
jgi:acetyltransferase